MEVFVSKRSVETTGPVPSGVAEGLKVFVIKGKTRILVYEDVTIPPTETLAQLASASWR